VISCTEDIKQIICPSSGLCLGASQGTSSACMILDLDSSKGASISKCVELKPSSSPACYFNHRAISHHVFAWNVAVLQAQ
jgi:hypothetical protein